MSNIKKDNEIVKNKGSIGIVKISVVVCAYNEEENIYSCLKSLACQKGIDSSEYEVLIIDDESQDQTGNIVENILKEHNGNTPMFRYIRIQHRGLSVGRNTGLLTARAQLIAYVDADTVVDEYWVCEMLKAWKEYPNADSIGGRIRILNPRNKVAQLLHDAFYDKDDQWAIIGANMSFKRQRLLEIGGFCDIFVSRGDETYLFRKMGDDAKLEKWPSAVIYHKRPDSISSWLKERKSSGCMIVLIETMFKPKHLWLQRFAIKHMATVFIGFPLLVALIWKWPVVFPALLFIWLLRWKRSEIWKHIFYLYMEEHGFIKALISGYGAAILEDSGNIMFSLGILITYIMESKTGPLYHICSITKDHIVKELQSSSFAVQE